MKPYLHTIGVVVQDMPATLAFHRALGLDIPAGEDLSPHVEYVANSGYAIGFVAEAMVRQRDPRWQDSFGHRLNLQFRLNSPAEVDATHAKLVALGHTSYKAPWDAFLGQRFARVIDPNQNVVNLFSPLPGGIEPA